MLIMYAISYIFSNLILDSEHSDKLEKAVETKPPTPKPSSPLPAPELVTEPAVIEKEPEKPKPIYCSPLRADKPKVN